MDYPKFDTHILIVPDREGMEVYTEKLLIEKVMDGAKSYISISAKKKAPEEVDSLDREWIYNSSMFDIFIAKGFIDDHLTKDTDEYKSFIKHFAEFIKPFEDISGKINASDETGGSFSFAPFTMYYLTKNGYTLKFLFQGQDKAPDYIKMLEEALSTIVTYNKPGASEFKKAVVESYSKKEGY